jgi:nitrite reductase/ring-hydroxylating ferredoxin subunit
MTVFRHRCPLAISASGVPAADTIRSTVIRSMRNIRIIQAVARSLLPWFLVLLLRGDCVNGFLLRPSALPVLASPSSAKNRRRPVTALSVSASPASSSASTPPPSTSPFANFDYNAHWYPVIWARDLLPNDPTRVTVFDVDYVVARVAPRGDGHRDGVIALEDRCPHKAAALSEGRITETGHFQCAYHGWSFNGTDGRCVDIPQLAALPDGKGGTTAPKGGSAVLPSRSCARAIPAQIHQEMVYLFVGGSLEESLLAPPPPTVPEYEVDGGNFQMSLSVRDMPVDWPIVVSNICDADHGLFAHQAKPFDMYSASTEYPMEVVQEFPDNGRGWIMKTKVDAADKLLKVDRVLREEQEGTKTHFTSPLCLFVGLA